ncbi:endosomal targeting BRO1-like domain protein, putative [Medicago truncatula]|uniref:Endosomal targeting BRO1-like domain protein, putative n=1 Tax=Medicago truncatula TaxID=3880 RepID=G7KK89_MEDTR|nr:endosomal targeting BRO1-like domain protein, putative [Medicago truncatula]
MAVAALQAADEYFKESKKLCEAFNTAPPLSRNPPLWGTMKYLSEKNSQGYFKQGANKPRSVHPRKYMKKKRTNVSNTAVFYDRIMETAPTLPEFSLALKPDEYQLPPVGLFLEN